MKRSYSTVTRTFTCFTTSVTRFVSYRTSMIPWIHIVIILSLLKCSRVVSQTCGPNCRAACNGLVSNDFCTYTKSNGNGAVGYCNEDATECVETACHTPETNCPNDQTGYGYNGTEACWNSGKPAPGPLRGAVACVFPDALARRPTATAGNQVLDAVRIYGPLENGFVRRLRLLPLRRCRRCRCAQETLTSFVSYKTTTTTDVVQFRLLGKQYHCRRFRYEIG